MSTSPITRAQALRALPTRRGLVLLFLATIIAVELITVSGILLAQKARTDEALEAHLASVLNNVVDETRENAAGFLGRTEQAVLQIKGLFAAEILTSTSGDLLERAFLNQLELIASLDGLFIGKPNGEFFFVKRNPKIALDGTESSARFLIKHISNDSGERRVQVREVDVQGNTLSTKETPEDDYEARERPWYRQAIEREGLIWTEPYVFFTARAAGITAAVPLVVNGQFIGVLGADVVLDTISNFLARQPIVELGSAAVVDSERKVIASSDPMELAQTANSDKLRLKKFEELSGNAAELVRLAELDNKTMRRPWNKQYVNDGERYMAMQVPFMNEKGLAWNIIVHGSDEPFVGELREVQRQSIIIAIAVSLLVTLLAFFLGPRLMRPVMVLHDRASKDALTELPNRRTFLEVAQDLLQRGDLENSPCSVLVLDVDHFKRINDTYGHPIGDEVLKAIAGRIKGSLTKKDLVARIGGEEFAVILQNANVAAAEQVADRIRQVIADTPVGAADKQIAVTVSAGVAEYDPERQTLNDLIAEADHALLEAKRAGRNRVEVSTPWQTSNH